MRYIVIAAALMLAGCQTVEHATPSGRPEVTVAAAPSDVKAAYVGAMTNLGYSVIRDTPFQIVMDRQVDSVMTNVLMGSQYDPTVEARITTTFIDLSGNTRVTADLGIVRNGGSAFEAVTNMTNSPDSPGVQSLLNDIKLGLESGMSVPDVVNGVGIRSISDRAKPRA